MVRRYGTIGAFSTQPIEHMHHVHKRLYQHSTNHKGTEAIEQIIRHEEALHQTFQLLDDDRRVTVLRLCGMMERNDDASNSDDTDLALETTKNSTTTF